MQNTEERLLNEREASRVLGCSPATMRWRRKQGRTPGHYKIGRKVLYRLSDLERYLARCKVEQTTVPTV
ncbi:MAG: helix-turn-helix domain-containing protein [Acidobacteria bacterium]|nr:helix-turn-helix domain-containing protein [Acidobacteriota bacterium]